MISSSKTKLLVTAVIFLLLTNIGMLIFFLCCKGPGKREMRGGREAQMRGFLQKDIGFSDKQLQQYDSLNKNFRENIKRSFTEIAKNSEKEMKLLGQNGFSDSAIAIAVDNASSTQKQMMENMFKHYKEIRQLCTNDQQPKFDSLFYKVYPKREDKHKKPEN